MDWHDTASDDQPQYGTPVWIFCERMICTRLAIRVRLGDAMPDAFVACGGRPSDPPTIYHDVLAWAPVEYPPTPVRVPARWSEPLPKTGDD